MRTLTEALADMRVSPARKLDHRDVDAEAAALLTPADMVEYTALCFRKWHENYERGWER